MPDISDQERGRRFFQLQKEKHAEEALEKVRKNLGDGWKVFTLQDVKTLRAMLGEAWVFTDRKAWGGYSFARLSRDDMDEILRIGRSMERREKTGQDAAREVGALLHRVS
jgi:flagellar biosynthesis GTPase FlhF